MKAQLDHTVPTPFEAAIRVWAAECRDKALMLIQCHDAYQANRHRSPQTLKALWETVLVAARNLEVARLGPKGVNYP